MRILAFALAALALIIPPVAAQEVEGPVLLTISGKVENPNRGAVDPSVDVFFEYSEAEFDALARNGAFAVHWRAHGLHYGIPTTIKYQLGLGKDCLVNFSRRALREAARVFPELVVLNVTASPDTVAERLVSRNRESRADIRKRLAEAQKELPPGLDVRTLPNDGPVSDTVARAILLLGPRGDAGPMDRHRETQGRPESESIQ